MEQVLRFFRDNELLIYFGLGILAIYQVRKFIIAWEELRAAAFGLERENAQANLNRAAGILVFLLVIGVMEFSLVSFVAPSVPGAFAVSTPTVDLLATPTVTLQSTVSPEALAAETTPLPTLEVETEGCVPGSVEIVFPKDGDTVSGIVEVRGSANIPNFGFYKFEVAALGDTSWLTIQAGETITTEGKLGYWDTTQLNQGEYFLRLVVTDNQGLSLPACAIQVRVTQTENP